VGLVRGFFAPFRGALFVAHHRLWSHFVLPVLLNLALGVGAAWGATALIRHWLGDQLSQGGWAVVGWLLYGVAGLVGGVLIFIVGQATLSAPFVDLLTEKVETIVVGRSVSMGLLRSAWQAVLHGTLKTLLYLIALLAIFGLGAATGVGALLGAALYGLFLAYDGFDYPLARRGLSFWDKWRYLGSHPGQTLGYCLGASVLYLVPLMALLAPGFAAVGATLAFLDGDRAVRPDRY
jgi:uncharacterized protein involved in cysteine biosynthesis